MTEDNPTPPPVVERPETHKPHASETVAESTADPAGAKDRSTAGGETSDSQTDEISKAQALMNGVGELAGQLVDGVKSLAKEAGDMVKQAGVVGVITAASLVHPMADIGQLSDQAGSAGGGPTLESGPIAGADHAGTAATATGGKAEYVTAASAATSSESQPEETPGQKLGEDLDQLADEMNKNLRENDEENQHPVIINGEFDPEDNQE